MLDTKNKISNTFTVLCRSEQENPVVSVVVAMYNNGDNGYLRRCLRSIEMQDCDKAEYILVDDCSGDDTLDIAVSFASKRSDTTVAKLAENSGPGTARNVAIGLAQGSYISVLDSDDYISAGYYNSMCAAAERSGADCIFSEFIQIVDAQGGALGGVRSNFPDPSVVGELTVEKRKNFIIKHGQFGMYRRTLFNDPQNLYLERVKYEDLPPFIRWVFQIESIGSAVGACHYYRMNPASITHTTTGNIKMLADRMKSSDLIIDGPKEMGVYEQYRDALDYYFMQVAYFNTLPLLLEGGWAERIPWLKSHCAERVPDFLRNPYHKRSGVRKRFAEWVKWRFPLATTKVLRALRGA